jgi:integrase
MKTLSTPDSNGNQATTEGGKGKDLLPHFFVSVCGREYKVFKRKADRKAPFYVSPERRGVRYRRCLETNVQDQAALKAKEIVFLVMNDRIDELNKLKVRGSAQAEVKETRCATVGRILEVYREVTKGFLSGNRTVPDNINALRLIIREGLGKPGLDAESVDGLRGDVALTGSVVARFERDRIAAAGDDEEKRQRAISSVNVYARVARSIFKDKWRKRMVRDFNLVLPASLEEFLNEELQQAARSQREAISEELMLATFKGSQSLKVKDPDGYAVFLMGLVSLRRREIQWARKDWLQEECGRWFFRIPRGSNKSKIVRVVPIPAAVALELREYIAATEGKRSTWEQDFILPCPAQGQGGMEAKSRAQNICKRVNKWMRGLGWNTQHTLHELRAYYITKLRETHGLEIAGEVGGHSDLRVTRQHYTGALDVRRLDVSKVPVIFPSLGTGEDPVAAICDALKGVA